MTISVRGLRFIEVFEGYVAHPADDGFGNSTVGFGHLWQPGEPTSWSRAYAEEVLKRELDAKYLPPVLAAFRAGKLTPTQNEVDSCVSLSYNVGVGVFDATHTIGAALRRGDRVGAANAFLLYDHANGRRVPGLTRRRKAERAMFLLPVQDVSSWRVELAKIRARLHTRLTHGQRHFLRRRAGDLRRRIKGAR